MLCYNRSQDAISLISVDFDHSAQLTNPVPGAGRFLSVTSLGPDADIAYLDPAQNAIVIRKSPPLE